MEMSSQQCRQDVKIGIIRLFFKFFSHFYFGTTHLLLEYYSTTSQFYYTSRVHTAIGKEKWYKLIENSKRKDQTKDTQKKIGKLGKKESMVQKSDRHEGKRVQRLAEERNLWLNTCRNNSRNKYKETKKECSAIQS